MAKPQRAFALAAALLLFISTVGFSGLVIWQMNTQEKAKDPYADLPAEVREQLKAQEALQNTQPDDASCEGSTGGDLTAVPEAYKPAGDVTALEATDLEVGTGAEVISGTCLQLKYHGTFATSGEKFDGNFDQPQLYQVIIGQGNVIQGWDQGLIGMREGGTRRLVIPSELAYGPDGRGSIPPNADLVFVVKLVKIKE